LRLPTVQNKKNGSPVSDGKCIGKPILCHGFDEFTRIKKPEFRIDHQERPEGFRKRDFGSKTKPSGRLFCLPQTDVKKEKSVKICVIR